MQPVYRIHPSIGIARLGDSPDQFYIGPDKPAALPTECDLEGNPVMSPYGAGVPVKNFKDAQGRIKRQAARFQVYVYDDESPEGRPLNLTNPVQGGGNHGRLIDVQWRVHVANKKSAWYEFHGLQGEHGYDDTCPLRNASITDPNQRQRLIIDPGPRFVNTNDRRRASFDRNSSCYAPIFPPENLSPRPIDTLGDLLTDNAGRLLVLGGHGNSGSCLSGLGQPSINNYANNDGWFDDISDGPVMARLVMYSDEVQAIRYIDVEYPAWVIVGYPRYCPEILDMVTLDDVVYDLAVRKFAWRTDLYGVPGTFPSPQAIDASDRGALMHWNAGPLDWNPGYKPWFYRDVWPLLFRVDEFRYLNNVLMQSNAPHDQTQRGSFDVTRLSVPPVVSRLVLHERQHATALRNQSGELFLEEIELQLHVFDDVVNQSLRRKLKAQALSTEETKGVAHQLRAARSAAREGHQGLDHDALKAVAAAFADAVIPAGPDGSPEAYHRAWHETYERGGPVYTAAKNRLQLDVLTALAPFIQEAVARWSGGMPRAGALAALLRQAHDGTLEAVVTEAVTDIAEAAMRNFRDGRLLDIGFTRALDAATNDPFRDFRQYLYGLLRKPGEENVFKTAGKPNNRLFRIPLMPLLAGDNPTSNVLPSKFLRLTDYQLYILRQWANGLFYNEVDERWVPDTAVDPYRPYQYLVGSSARDLDRGVLMNLLGGAFFPGAEVCWVIRNPSIYKEPYRLKADPDFYNFGQTAANENAVHTSEQDYLANTGVELSLKSNFDRGLRPGDLTKYSALPWQADFNECSIQPIDITYELWNSIDPSNEDDPWMKAERKTWDALWWPAHRPLQTYEITSFSDGKPSFSFLGWTRGVPQTFAGDLKMVTEWSRLGFVIRNPYAPPDSLDAPSPDTKYISVERNRD
jgi:hypothetical protein